MEIYKKLFLHLNTPPPSKYLNKKIMKSINASWQKRKKIRLVFSVVSLFLSAIFELIELRILVSDLYKSGFEQIFSLFFSNMSIVKTNLYNFLLSLAESFPVTDTLVFLLFLFIFMYSVSNILIIRKSKQFKLWN